MKSLFSALQLLKATGPRYRLFLISFPIVAVLEVLGVGILPGFFAVIADPRPLQHFLERAPAIRSLVGANAIDAIGPLGAILVIFFLAKNSILVAIGYLQTRYVARCQAQLSAKLLSTYLSLPYAFHLQRKSAELVRNTTGVTFNVFTGVVIPGCIAGTEGLVVCFVAILLFVVSPLSTTVAMALLLILASAFYLVFRTKVRRLGQEQLSHSAEMIKWITEALGGVKELKVFGRASYFVAQYERQITAFSRANLIFNTIGILPRFVLETLFVVAAVAVTAVLIREGRSLQDAFGTLVLFGVAGMRLMPSFTRIMGAATMVRFNLPALHTVEQELALPGRRPELSAPELTSIRLREGIEFRSVGFRYEDSVRDALKDVSLRIARGELVALVGRSGSGKSTLVDILIGLHRPATGEVLIDGVPMENVLASWQRSIGYVPQHIFLTDDSLRRNVAFGIPDAEIDEGRVQRALTAASLEPLLSRLDAGLNSRMGERGALLSGGERQRIGLARALYHDPDVIVLDEATAALDRSTESEIAALLQRLAGQRTVVLIAHQMATVRISGKIIVMDDGSVSAIGTYAELLAGNPRFQELVE